MRFSLVLVLVMKSVHKNVNSNKGTLWAKPGCKWMRAKGPSRCQSTRAPKVWTRMNEEEALWTARSLDTTGSVCLTPFTVTVPYKEKDQLKSFTILWTHLSNWNKTQSK